MSVYLVSQFCDVTLKHEPLAICETKETAEKYKQYCQRILGQSTPIHVEKRRILTTETVEKKFKNFRL